MTYKVTYELTDITQSAKVTKGEWDARDVELTYKPDMRETEKEYVADEMVDFITDNIDTTMSSQEFKIVLLKSNDQGEYEEAHELTTTINNDRY